MTNAEVETVKALLREWADWHHHSGNCYSSTNPLWVAWKIGDPPPANFQSRIPKHVWRMPDDYIELMQAMSEIASQSPARSRYMAVIRAAALEPRLKPRTLAKMLGIGAAEVRDAKVRGYDLLARWYRENSLVRD